MALYLGSRRRPYIESVSPSRMDYRCFINISATKTARVSLNSISTMSLQIYLGAFRSSLSKSVHVEDNTSPICLRREQLVLTYDARVSADPYNSCHDFIISHHFHNNQTCRPRSTVQKISSLMHITNLTQTHFFHQFHLERKSCSYYI